MFNDNSLKLGTWVQISSPDIVEILGANGFDFVILDLEHGNIDFRTLENLIRAAELYNVYPIVRVPEYNQAQIMKVLDLGAKGIMVPQITSKEEVEQVVQAVKYPPIGHRGSCPCIRAGSHLVDDWERFSKSANKNISAIVLVEGVEGIENFEEIVSVENVDAFMIGPFDLSVSLGVPGEVNHKKIKEKLEEIISLAHQHNKKIIGVDFSSNETDIKENLRYWRSLGSNILMTGIDKLLLGQKVKSVTKIIDCL